jgi:hypothetical protein
LPQKPTRVRRTGELTSHQRGPSVAEKGSMTRRWGDTSQLAPAQPERGGEGGAAVHGLESARGKWEAHRRRWLRRRQGLGDGFSTRGEREGVASERLLTRWGTGNGNGWVAPSSRAGWHA